MVLVAVALRPLACSVHVGEGSSCAEGLAAQLAVL